MMLPSIFRENLFDDWMNDAGLMSPDFFGKGHSPLYGKHASNIMKTDIRENKDSYDVIVDLPGDSEFDASGAMGEGVFHMNDLFFFAESMRDDMIRRAAAWRKSRPAED